MEFRRPVQYAREADSPSEGVAVRCRTSSSRKYEREQFDGEQLVRLDAVAYDCPEDEGSPPTDGKTAHPSCQSTEAIQVGHHRVGGHHCRLSPSHRCHGVCLDPALKLETFGYGRTGGRKRETASRTARFPTSSPEAGTYTSETD